MALSSVRLSAAADVMPFAFVYGSGLLQALPLNYGRRSEAELRARTLLGAAECLRGGITTVPDMLTLAPRDEADLEVVLDA